MCREAIKLLNDRNAIYALPETIRTENDIRILFGYFGFEVHLPALPRQPLARAVAGDDCAAEGGDCVPEGDDCTAEGDDFLANYMIENVYVCAGERLLYV